MVDGENFSTSFWNTIQNETAALKTSFFFHITHNNSSSSRVRSGGGIYFNNFNNGISGL